MYSEQGMRKKKFKPAGLEFEGKCQYVEEVARQLDRSRTEVRMAEYLFYNGSQWTVRTTIEQFVDGNWQEVEWNPRNHSIMV